MLRSTPIRIAAALTTVAAVLVCGSALAYYTTSGESSGLASFNNLRKTTVTPATPAAGGAPPTSTTRANPTSPAAPPAAGGTVSLTWAAVTPPSTGTVTYYVTRDGEAPAGTCPSSAAPTTVTSCVDKGLEPGTHTYVVT